MVSTIHNLKGLRFRKEKEGLIFILSFSDYYGDVTCHVIELYPDYFGGYRECVVSVHYHVNKDFKDLREFLEKVEEEINSYIEKKRAIFKIFEEFGWKLEERDC